MSHNTIFFWLIILAVALFGIGVIGHVITGADRQREDDRESKKKHGHNDPPHATTYPVPIDAIETQASQDGPTYKRQSEMAGCGNGVNWERIFSACLVLFAFISAVVAYWQWAAMERQNAVMIAQNRISQGQLNAMAEQNSEIVKQSSALIEQTELNREQLRQSAKAISQTDSVINQMRLEQQPWLSAREPTIKDEAVDFANFNISLPVINSGHTPAWLKSGGAGAVIVLVDSNGIHERINELFTNCDGITREDVIAPGVTMNCHAVMTNINFDGTPSTPAQTAAIVANINSGRAVVYVGGRFKYQDSFGSDHFLEFCFSYDPKSKSFLAHDRYNDMK